ncbi:MAG TPA: TetR/AcrR family transcriptional regulator [Azospirillum sp.]|nr:TetR/AcrR family transcriptional regulator [Azospirillum sp.]
MARKADTAPDKRETGARLGRADWVAAARRALVDGGVAEVKVDRLATRLRVTRGSFYWHFKSRAELLDALLEDWRHANVEPFLSVLDGEGEPVLRLKRFFGVWLNGAAFDPALDSAMRDWARTSRPVARLVREADAARTDVLRRIFAAMGYPEPEAEVRARVAYYHQVGYYALGIVESRQLREALFPLYFKVLAGHDVPEG